MQLLNAKLIGLWMASHFAPLLVIWSPWVTGFTLSCFSFLVFCPFPSFAFPENMSIFILYFSTFFTG